MDASYSITFAGANPVTGSGTFDVVGGSIIDFTATINTVPWVPAAPLINVDSGVVGSIEPVGEPAFPDSFMELASDGTWAMGPGFNDCVLCDPTIQAGASGTYTLATIPEPSTLALFATGLALLAFLGWRRRGHDKEPTPLRSA